MTSTPIMWITYGKIAKADSMKAVMWPPAGKGRKWPDREHALLPYTMALGGMATGNMKAQFAPSAAGTARSRGSSPILNLLFALAIPLVSYVALLLFFGL